MYDPIVLLEPTYEEVHNACVRFVQQLHTLDMMFDCVAGLSRGGLIPATIISHLLGLPLVCLEYSSKIGKGNNKNHNNALPVIPHGLVLIVDDICDTGHTLKEIKQYYERTNGIYSFVLYYKKLIIPNFHPDFSAWNVPEGSGWITFPWEK